MVHATCAALNCPSSSRLNKELKFHQFPHEVERRNVWLRSCNRTEYIIEKDAKFFKNKYVCSLHFAKSMYHRNKHLKKTAIPSLNLSTKTLVYNSSTQTLEYIDFFPLNPEITEHPEHVLGKKEVKTTYTQTDDCLTFQPDLETKAGLKDVKIEKSVQYVAPEHKIKKEIEEETLFMFSEDSLSFVEPKLEIMEEIKECATPFEEGSTCNLPKENTSSIPKKIDKSTETDNVKIFMIPKICDHYFQECFKCGQRQRVTNRHAKIDNVDEEDTTLEEFLKGCDKFLAPIYSTIIKNQITLEGLNQKLLNPEPMEKTKRYKTSLKRSEIENSEISGTLEAVD